MYMRESIAVTQSSSDLKGPCLTTLHASDEDAVYGMQKIKNHLEEVHSVVRRGELTKVYSTTCTCDDDLLVLCSIKFRLITG